MRVPRKKPKHINPSSAELEARKYLTVREAARLLTVSMRSIYGYIASGSLPAYQIGSVFVVETEEVRVFQRRAVGRKRSRVPAWHTPPVLNAQYITTIRVHLLPEQNEPFFQKMQEIRLQRKHLLPGTCARYISRNHAQPEEIQITFVWRQSVMPAESVREAALAEMRADLAEVLDWETAVVYESQVMLTA